MKIKKDMKEYKKMYLKIKMYTKYVSKRINQQSLNNIILKEYLPCSLEHLVKSEKKLLCW